MKRDWRPDWLRETESTSVAIPAEPAADGAVVAEEPRGLWWRAEVAGWSQRSREAWGRLANSLEDGGMRWDEAEREAFERIEGGSVALDAIPASSARPTEAACRPAPPESRSTQPGLLWAS